MITLAFVAENDMYYYFLNKVFALVTACWNHRYWNLWSISSKGISW